ncbi:NUDIX domain-containing protein [Candidatus Jorgensenbacteria bacterium]|nr:NUDIX domain-containing protein [Candidatus Jorgensenbacteria bacterium]
MSKPKERIQDGKIIHYSVGALIQEKGRYLLIERGVPPPGFAGIAGHIDQNETPEEALKREVEEESGLKIQRYELLFQEFITWNWCSKGVTGHYWYLFECQVSGEIKINVRETKSIKWYTAEEIRTLALEPVWKHWFEKTEIIVV